MNNPETILHTGVTCLLSRPMTRDGKEFPFHFLAASPKIRKWSYRILPPPVVPQLTDHGLTEFFKARPTPLRAKWTEQVNHPTGLLKIYFPQSSKTSEDDFFGAEIELGPELGLDMQPPQNATDREKPKREEPSPDDFEMTM